MADYSLTIAVNGLRIADYGLTIAELPVKGTLQGCLV